MPRPKLKDEKDKLSYSVIIRVNEATFKRLETLAAGSGYCTVAEIARKILSNERLNIFHKDTSMNGPRFFGSFGAMYIFSVW